MRALPRFNKSVCAGFLAPVFFLLGCNSHQHNPYGGRGGFQNYGNSFDSGFNQGMVAGLSGLGVDWKNAACCFVIDALLGAFFSQRFKKWRKWIMAALFGIGAAVHHWLRAHLDAASRLRGDHKEAEIDPVWLC